MFSPDRRAASGRQAACKACRTARHVAAYAADPHKHRERARRSRGRTTLPRMIVRARRRAAKRGLAFDLDMPGHAEALKKRLETGKCELTGIPFYTGRGYDWRCPSLDRIDSRKGYLYRNTRIILVGLNAALGNWGHDVLVDMVARMKRRRRR